MPKFKKVNDYSLIYTIKLNGSDGHTLLIKLLQLRNLNSYI